MLFCLVVDKILGGLHLTHDSTQQVKLVIIPESVDSLKIQMLDFNFIICFHHFILSYNYI